MKKDIVRHIIIAGLLLLNFSAAAQVMLPSADISRDEILIGQQAELTLSLEITLRDDWPEINFPYKQDEITTGVEIVETSPVDTIQPDSNNPQLYQLSQRYLITSFDSGLYDISRMAVVVNGDSLFTNPLQLAVNTVQVDTTQTAIYDIKDIYDIELTWKDYFALYGWIALAILLFVALIILVVYFLRKRKQKPVAATEKPAPVIPPHILALEALEKLEQEKAWQNRPLKIYHTDLTDIIREYIEGRYRVPAHEQTSNEVLQNLRFVEMPEDAALRLRHVLKLADMVKFAKEQPTIPENEQSYQYAREFVTMTQPVEKPAPDNAEDENNDQNQQQ